MNSKILFKISGLCGILLPIVFSIVIIYSINASPWFSWTEGAISDLGMAEGSPLLFNNGLILIGILLLIFSIGLIKSSKEEKVGPKILLLSSFCFIGIGILPEPSLVHYYPSVFFFTLFIISFLIIGMNNYGKTNRLQSKMGFFALANIAIAFFSSIFLILFSGIAIPEVLIIFPGFLWCMVYGFILLLKGNTL